MYIKEENNSVITIKPQKGWQRLDLKELLEYRDLFVMLVKRDIKVQYAQTILGFSWAILNPLLQIVLFTIIFCNDKITREFCANESANSKRSMSLLRRFAELAFDAGLPAALYTPKALFGFETPMFVCAMA